MSSRTWQDWLNVAAGIWLVLSPWILGFSTTTSAMWTFIVLGALIAGVAIAAMTRATAAGSEWLAALLGAATFAAPWLFGLDTGAMRWNAWIVGALVVVLAIWALTAHGREPMKRVPG